MQDFGLVIQDDGSSDSTMQLLRKYRALHPAKVAIGQNKTNLGAAYNFLGLMAAHKDDYIMLCDQDDVWLPKKIENTLEEMRRMEAVYGKQTPVLVHTDLTVVDENLNLISDSYLKMAGVDSIDSVKQMVLRNNVAGCTVMYNRALANLLTEVPQYCVMHDFWLAQAAFCFGKTSCIPSQILYRQHGKNALGAQSVHGLRHKWHKIMHSNEIRQALFASYKQAGEFLKVYGGLLSEADRCTLAAYAAMPQMTKFGRLVTMNREKLFRKGLIRKLSQIAFG
jgi:glycosyltransferase involved in cell wall biosynthesis